MRGIKFLHDIIFSGGTYGTKIGLLVLELFAGQVAGIFKLSGDTEEICIGAIRIISAGFIFVGINIALQGVFQALDGGVETLVISVCRQILFVLPVAWGFARLAIKEMKYVWLVWLTFPIAEIVTLVIACIFMRRIRRNRIIIL